MPSQTERWEKINKRGEIGFVFILSLTLSSCSKEKIESELKKGAKVLSKVPVPVWKYPVFLIHPLGPDKSINLLNWKAIRCPGLCVSSC